MKRSSAREQQVKALESEGTWVEFPFLERLRKELILIRKRHNLSQEDMGRILGLGQTGYGSYERGRTDLCHIALDRAIEFLEERREMAVLGRQVECPKCKKLTVHPMHGGVHCVKCGHRLVKRCPKCDTTETDDKAKFCRHCGGKLEG